MLENGRVVAGSGRLEGSGKWTETQQKKWGESATAVQSILSIINSASVQYIVYRFAAVHSQ
jgi:hypothetical protein